MNQIKPCHRHLYQGLDHVQMQYAVMHGYDNSELSYRAFRVQLIDPFMGIVTKRVHACCREHARAITKGAINVSEE
jgi:hypothetical protein